jgi:hypothetical protein
VGRRLKRRLTLTVIVKGRHAPFVAERGTMAKSMVRKSVGEEKKR